MIRVPGGELRSHHGMKPVASGNPEKRSLCGERMKTRSEGTAQKTGGNAER